ncbi:DUF2891 domain-containing protein [Christiangramia sabulilitoris]|uniref:DUF2891 domain-containing protein n=1 Tax=Christiangramia sabulilitoris TaxID=2583991 RepID=A0A550I2I3_9FLAO|nr:DUF2891 domain-containing protein [Christiangramia sabulilitoris]TRO65194.1 DUF2891 domain-containing protein [Christiangramia sabulilitoris]
MKRFFLVILCLGVISCKGDKSNETENNKTSTDSIDVEALLPDGLATSEPVILDVEEANKLVELPLGCIATEYPNKLGQTLENKEAMGEPHELHPAFYGCFDWHSSVHAHWSLVSLLKQFPKLEKKETIRETLKNSLSSENIQGELEYFNRAESGSFERTYGWAWLLQLAEELRTWEDPLGQELANNLQPLTDYIVQEYIEFLPKLNYPIRVGEHTNTAFGLTLAYDYANATGNEEFLEAIKKRAQDFYLKDDNCPVSWEPGGYDFLSPCLSEIDIMRRVLPKNAFSLWMDDFMPQMKKKDFEMEVGEVSDRTDGKLVHLDGLNFSRAWVLYGLANQYPQQFGHLKTLANEHVAYSFPNVVGDSYEGGHWLGTFAIYALQEAQAKVKQ